MPCPRRSHQLVRNLDFHKRLAEERHEAKYTYRERDQFAIGKAAAKTYEKKMCACRFTTLTTHRRRQWKEV